jgi:hypothetical protein
MPAVVPATKTAPQMILGRENHQAALIKIIIARMQSRVVLGRTPAMKRSDTRATETPAVALLRWHASQQLRRKFNRRAPARAFVGGSGAKLAIVRPAAQQTSRSIKIHRRIRRYFGRSGHAIPNVFAKLIWRESAGSRHESVTGGFHADG